MKSLTTLIALTLCSVLAGQSVTPGKANRNVDQAVVTSAIVTNTTGDNYLDGHFSGIVYFD